MRPAFSFRISKPLRLGGFFLGGFAIRGGDAFLEHVFRRDSGFFLFGTLGQNILSAGLALGFVLAAGDIDAPGCGRS